MKMIHENLKALRVKSGLKQEEIANLVGITGKNWSSYERGKTEPNIETLVKLATEFKITVDTLVQRDVSLIAKTLVQKKQENARLNVSPSVSPMSLDQLNEPSGEYGNRVPKVVTVDNTGRDNVAFVPVKARAGYLAGYGDPEFVETLPAYSLPGLNNGIYRMFELEGQSMVPSLYESDLVIGRFVENMREIRSDRVHVVVTKRDGVVVKRVINRIEKDGVLILNSDNQRHKEDYPPIIVRPEDILEIWYAVVFMSRQFRAPGELYNRLIDVESRLTLMEQGMPTGGR
ncbi:MAG: LexA family transcriptional regulator [Cyclobacteriaceae bacterium]|nr:LexA family transcriptional regulator [Cyclobacteriaceae bacterium]